MKRIILFVGCIVLLAVVLVHRSDRQPSVLSASTVFQPTKPSIKPTPSSAILPAAAWVPQTFNNCGPAATSMLLQYFGYSVDQNETKRHLRTGDDDVNVTLPEIAAYIKNDYGIESKIFYNGDIATLKKLIVNGFYVMVEDWLHPNEDIGHVLIIRGYDDAKGVLITDDSYLGVGKTYPYDEFEKTQWKPFNREYMPVYQGSREAALKEIVGTNWDPTVMYQHAIDKARTEIEKNPEDMYAYFNVGTSYFGLKEYREAYLAFEKSKSLLWPKRMLWYQTQPIETAHALGISYLVQ